MVACILCAVQDLVKTYRVTEEDKKDADKEGGEDKMKGEIHSVPPSPIQLPPFPSPFSDSCDAEATDIPKLIP